MIRLEKIPLAELKKAVARSYENDNELFEKYHITKGFDNCVESTMALIIEMDGSVGMAHYNVLWKGKLIGYVCKYDGFLYSYAINITYRKKRILMLWWDEVSRLMGGVFKTAVYGNNIRAKDFLLRNGMKIISEQNNIVTLFKL